MANTYTQLYVHFVFSPFGRENVIPQRHKVELQKYTTGIIQNRKYKLLAINYMPDHVHIFMGISPVQSLSDLMRDVKANTSKFINEKKMGAWKVSLARRVWRIFLCAFSD